MLQFFQADLSNFSILIKWNFINQNFVVIIIGGILSGTIL